MARDPGTPGGVLWPLLALHSSFSTHFPGDGAGELRAFPFTLPHQLTKNPNKRKKLAKEEEKEGEEEEKERRKRRRAESRSGDKKECSMHVHTSNGS